MPSQRPPYSRVALIVTLAGIVLLVILDYWASAA
jgi:hypothetical protein